LIAVPDSWSIDDDMISFVLADDLIIEDDRFPEGNVIQVDEFELARLVFKHRTHEWIRFGALHCCTYMMYIACVGDDLGGEFDIVEFTDEQLLTFLKVKSDLIAQERLPSDSMLSATPNCCS
jgi:hypothetical protein